MEYFFDGKRFATKKEEGLKLQVNRLRAKGIVPKLVAILVGDDPGSKLYVSLKQKAAIRIGIEFLLLQPVEAHESEITKTIEKCNRDGSIHGILVQLPLPGELSNESITARILKTVDLNKDVDGLREGSPYLPATVKGILTVIREAQRENYLHSNLNSETICVVGYTGEVGSRLVTELEKECENILLINSKTLNPQVIARKASLLISAVGKPGLVTKDWIKSGAVVIDVGSPRGDIQEDVQEVASFVTPVPGGIGPMTVLSLLENTLISANSSENNR